MEESEIKFKGNSFEKESIFEKGKESGIWLKFIKDEYWVYLSFNKSGILISIMLSTFDISESS